MKETTSLRRNSFNDLEIGGVQFDPNGYWDQPIDEGDPRFKSLVSGNKCVYLFDQNGYDLCPLEQLYAEANGITCKT